MVKNLAEICPVTIPEISLSKKSVTIVEIPFRSALKPQNFRLRRSFYNAKSHLVALSTRKNFACGAHSLMQLKKRAMTLLGKIPLIAAQQARRRHEFLGVLVPSAGILERSRRNF